jgi:hypothetical protein
MFKLELSRLTCKRDKLHDGTVWVRAILHSKTNSIVQITLAYASHDPHDSFVCPDCHAQALIGRLLRSENPTLLVEGPAPVFL